MKPAPTVFLDRDGTLNVDHGYVHRAEDFEFIAGVPQALHKLQYAGYRLIVVTNQSGVARGMYGEAQVQALHAHMAQQLAPLGVEISAYYYCPFHPDYGDSHYRRDSPDRKPKLGMFQRAQQQFPVDSARSYMIGDKLEDMAFGRNAGLQPILVRTGKGAGLDLPQGAWSAPHMPAAAELILSQG